MTMFKCEECGNLFEEGEQKKWIEPHGEKMSGCPLCRGNYDEIKPCKICGDYDHDIDDDYCDDCRLNVKMRFKNFVDKEFTKEERELLNELYDGEWI